jgi:hypothetical protein
MDKVFSAFLWFLKALAGYTDPEGARCRELQPGLATCPSFLLPDTQETMLVVVCQGDLTTNPSSPVY